MNQASRSTFATHSKRTKGRCPPANDRLRGPCSVCGWLSGKPWRARWIAS